MKQHSKQKNIKNYKKRPLAFACFCLPLLLLLAFAFVASFAFAGTGAKSGENVLEKSRQLHRYGKTELAVKRLRDMLKAEPDNTGAQGFLGIILSDMGSDYADEAIEWLNKAIEGRPEEPDYHVGLCRALRNLGGKRFKDAEAECRKALELDTRRYSVYRERGLLYQASGDLKKGRPDMGEGGSSRSGELSRPLSARIELSENLQQQ